MYAIISSLAQQSTSCVPSARRLEFPRSGKWSILMPSENSEQPLLHDDSAFLCLMYVNCIYLLILFILQLLMRADCVSTGVVFLCNVCDFSYERCDSVV